MAGWKAPQAPCPPVCVCWRGGSAFCFHAVPTRQTRGKVTGCQVILALMGKIITTTGSITLAFFYLLFSFP